MKLRTTLLTTFASMGLAVPAWSDVVGVDANGTVTATGVLDPSSRTWEAVGATFSLGAMTVTTGSSGGSAGGPIGDPPLPVFANYQYTAGGTISVTISGLDDAQVYNLVVYMAQNAFGDPGRGGTATVTSGGGASAGTDGDEFAVYSAGENHVRFDGLSTDGFGSITFDVTNGPEEGIGIFNGFEIENVTTPGLGAPAMVSDTTNGAAIQLTVPVTNSAGTAYDVTGTSYSGPNAGDFSDDAPINIPGGSSADLTIDFTPSSNGTIASTLTLTTNDPSFPTIDVDLSVDVEDPEIVIDPSLAFGFFPVLPGPTKGYIEVDNLGDTTALTLTLPATPITGTGAAAYSVTSLPASIGTGGFDQIEVTFNPANGGSYPAQLSLDTNDPFNPTVTVDLSGAVQGGGTPVMQWGFDFNSGTVQFNGGTVNDDAGNGNDGGLGAPDSGNGGTYTADIPTAGTALGEAQNVTGIGSLDVTGLLGVSTGTGAFSGEALNGLAASDVDSAGGLTYELWVKNVSNISANAHLLTVGGMHGIAVHPTSGVGFVYGDNSAFLTPETPIDTTDWTHIAVVMASSTVQDHPGTMDFYRITLYANGYKVAEDLDGHSFGIGWLSRGAGVGKHPVLGSDDADGLVYEPRISVGTLSPDDFTVVPPPPGIFAPLTILDSYNGGTTQLTIEVENTDTTGRNLDPPTFSGGDAGFFTVGSSPASIGAGVTDDIVVNFDSAVSGGGTFTTTLVINSNDPNRPAYEVELTVEVRDPEASAVSSLDFGPLTGPGTDVQSFYVDNFGANVALTLSNPQITGTGAAAFPEAGVTLPAPITAGGFGQVAVTFNLGTVGVFDAQLTLDTNDPFNPTITIDLTGEVTAVLGNIDITAVNMVSPTRFRIDFEGVANTAYDVKSSTDLATSPFTGAVTPAVDGLTTNDIGGGRGVGFVEIDVTVPGALFFQIQNP